MNKHAIGLDVALARQGHEVRRHSSDSNEIRVNCMFCKQLGHTPDTRFRLGINIKTGMAHCFQCHWKTRDIYKLLEKQSGQRVRPPDSAYEKKQLQDKEPELPEGFELFFSVDSRSGSIRARALAYLHGRGLTDEQIEYQQIGFTAIGRYAYRVVFPIHHKKKLVTFISRDFTGQQEVKFLNRKGVKPLWATEDMGDESKLGGSTVILYEGIFKSLAGERSAPYLTQGTVIHAATLGSQITDLQLTQLKPAMVDEVILFPDPDKPGMSGFLKVGHALAARHYERLTVVSPLPRRECDEMEPEEIEKCISGRQPFYEASWGMANYATMED